MSNPQAIAIADYDYPLPDERIAKFPLAQRDQSKLLVYRHGEIGESLFHNIGDHLPDGTLLMFNDTRVIHARLFFRKATGATIEVFCLEPYHMPVAQAFEQRERCTWLCFVGNNKKWKEGPLERTAEIGGKAVSLTATRHEAVGNAWVVELRWTGGFSLAEIIDAMGVIPLPPYLNREAEKEDNDRYQTVYAHQEGSVAAPTAGLHFTPELLDSLRARGVETDFITLHVGAGTFKPVSTETIGEHEMHVEQIEISRSNIQRVLDHTGRPLIPVGTTTVRTLESVYWFGVHLHDNPALDAMHVGQWDPYTLEARHVDTATAYRNVLDWMDRHGVETLHGDTRLMIAPGYKYHVISGLVTNFHQPKSTLLLLVSALVGDAWRDCYRYALDHGFRFLSYGDSCLFLP